jgi:LuxR family transcriptional regulator, maltose regulon positive regulatory protein
MSVALRGNGRYAGGGLGEDTVYTGVNAFRRRLPLKPPATRTPSADNRSGAVSLGDLLLTTKLNVPSNRSTLVVRPRLLRRLDEGSRGKLTLISAPAGYGKTTLLGEWVLRSEMPVGWVSLDEGDNDSTSFFSYLISALQTVETDIGESILRSLRAPQPPPTQVVLTALVNEIAAISNRNLALVLDDYHVIRNESIHAALAFLLEHLPPQMHLMIASRTDPPLPLARLLVGGHLTKLAAPDLRFTPEEVGSFLNEAMSLDLSAKDLAALEEHTEGWVAGLQLAALSVRGREDVSRFTSAFAGTDRHDFDYLADEVLDRQSKDTRSFLLQTSILDRLSGRLCDAVTGQGGGQAKLEELERMNLLMVPLDDERRWYRYHHLFSDFLRERLRRESPKLVFELHRRASGWHERNGTASEAIGHAVAAGDFDRAGDLTERLAGEMGGRGESPVLERLLRAMPEEVLRSRPRLQIYYAAFHLTASGRFDAAEARLRDVERMLGLGGVGLAEDSSVIPTVAIENTVLANRAGEVATVRASMACFRGDTESAIAFGSRALTLLAEENLIHRSNAAYNLAEAYLDSGDLVAAKRANGEAFDASRAAGLHTWMAGSLNRLGRLQAMQGRLCEARGTYDRVLRLAAELGEIGILGAEGEAHIGVGELLLERNDLEVAMRHMQEGVESLLKWSGLGDVTSQLLEGTEAHRQARRPEDVSVDLDATGPLFDGYLALTRARQAQGDTQGAFEALRKAESIAPNPHIGARWKSQVEAWRASLRLAQGDIKAAARWAQERGLSAEDELCCSPVSEFEHLTLARLLIAQGKHEEPLRLLERLLEDAEAGGRAWSVIALLSLKAVALRTQSDEPGALAALRRALILAEPEGYVRTFADEGTTMVDLLRRLLRVQSREPPGAENKVSPEYVGKVLEACGAGVTAPTRASSRGTAGLFLEPMTERELDVLRLLDTGLSNREIAQRLFVSLDTVKSHTKHIYAKLGVRARHQAVGRAKEFGLL